MTQGLFISGVAAAIMLAQTVDAVSLVYLNFNQDANINMTVNQG